MSTASATTAAKKAAPPRIPAKGTMTPPPAMLYLDAALKVRDPELQQQILAFCEQEQRDGMELARRADATARLGQIFGIASVSLVLALAAYVATLGEAAWATAITVIDVVGVAGTFVTGQVTARTARKRRA